MKSILAFHKAVADESRLRLVRLLDREALNVGELTRILGLAQSSVSQKLRELRRADVVRERREGGFSYYELSELTTPAFAALRAELRAEQDEDGDLARLAEVVRERRERGDGGGRLLEPGRSWVAWARALGFVLPPLKVVDLGCGDGGLTAEIASWASRVVAVERDERVLALARKRIERDGLDNVELVHGDIVGARLPARGFDLAVLSHALHFLDEPGPALERAYRLLAPGGRVLVLELAAHREAWVESKLGHARLGFTPAELELGLEAAGFAELEVELTPRTAAREPFRVLVASGVRA